MKVAVCDDEKIIRDKVKVLVEKQKPDCAITAFNSGEELLKAEEHFDIIFLDIQMNGLSGIDTAKLLRKKDRDAILIFITGIKEYVFEAFDVAAFQYLLKPISEDKFAEVFDRAAKEVPVKRVKEQERLFVKTRNRSLTIDKSHILYVESRMRKVEIHLADEVIETYATMNGMEKQLGGGFYRCHRGFLVNMAYILEYDTSEISLSNGEKVYMAKEKYNEFVKVYMKYLKDGGAICV